MTVVARGCAVAIHVNQTAKTSSPKLRAQLLSGSGVVLTAARALAFVPCEVSATPPQEAPQPSATLQVRRQPRYTQAARQRADE